MNNMLSKLFIITLLIITTTGCVDSGNSWEYSTKQDCYDMFCR